MCPPTVEAQREAATAVAAAAQLQLSTELAGARVDVAAAMEAAAAAAAAAAAEARGALADATDMAKQLRTVLPELSLLRDRLTHAGKWPALPIPWVSFVGHSPFLPLNLNLTPTM